MALHQIALITPTTTTLDLSHEMAAILSTNGFAHVALWHVLDDCLATNSTAYDLYIVQVDRAAYAISKAHRLRHHASVKNCPIILLCPPDVLQDNAVLSAGYTDVITIPIAPVDLITKCYVHIKNHQLVQGLRQADFLKSREISAAQNVLASILPHADHHKKAKQYGLTLDWQYTPSAELGGDYWQWWPLRDDYSFFCLADFSGHGVNAAAYLFHLHSVLQNIVSDKIGPSTLLAVMNENMKRLFRPGEFVTMLVGFIDTQNNVMRYASAGAPSPLCVPGQGVHCIVGQGGGLPAGLTLDNVYETYSLPFSHGDQLLFCSDGLFEVWQDSVFLGEEGWQVIVETESARTHPITLDRIMGHIAPYQPFLDDATLVSVARF